MIERIIYFHASYLLRYRIAFSIALVSVTTIFALCIANPEALAQGNFGSTNANWSNQQTGVSSDTACSASQINSNNSMIIDARQQQRAYELSNKAGDLFRHNEYQSALEEFTQALLIDSTLVDAHWGKALCYRSLHDYTNSMMEIQIVLQSSPDKIDFWCAAGEESIHLHRLPEACHYLRHALNIGGSNEKIRFATELIQRIEPLLARTDNGDYLSDATEDHHARWADSSFPIKIFIQEGHNVKGYQTALLDDLKQAFLDWSNISRGRIQFALTNNKSDAQITCSWIDDKRQLVKTNEAGVTRTTVDDGNNIVRADIKFFTMPGEDTLTDDEIKTRLKSVDLHEIGHALGLGHSKIPYDTMYFETCPAGLEFSLNGRDRNTILALYPGSTTSQSMTFSESSMSRNYSQITKQPTEQLPANSQAMLGTEIYNSKSELNHTALEGQRRNAKREISASAQAFLDAESQPAPTQASPLLSKQDTNSASQLPASAEALLESEFNSAQAPFQSNSNNRF